MQVFNAFLRVLRSKFGSAIIYIVLFFIVGIMMTRADSGTSVWEKTKMVMVIEDLDDTPESRKLVEFISEGNVVKDDFTNEDDITDAMYYTMLDYVVTIPKGYAEKLASGQTEGIIESRHMHESYAVANMGMLLDEYVNTVMAYRQLGKTSLEASEAACNALEAKVDVTIAQEEGKTEDSASMMLIYFRYMPYIFLCVIMNTLCPALVAMNKKDLRFRTDCSGLTPQSYTMQQFAASALYIVALWAVFTVVGAVINGVMFSGRLWLAVVNGLVFALFSAVFALFVSEFSPNPNVITAITQIASLGMCFLCGVFVDQALLGGGVLAAARFLPAYWYVRLIRMLNGDIVFTAGEAALCLGIQAGFVAVFVLLTILVHRARYVSATPRKAAAGSAA